MKEMTIVYLLNLLKVYHLSILRMKSLGEIRTLPSLELTLLALVYLPTGHKS